MKCPQFLGHFPFFKVPCNMSTTDYFFHYQTFSDFVMKKFNREMLNHKKSIYRGQTGNSETRNPSLVCTISFMKAFLLDSKMKIDSFSSINGQDLGLYQDCFHVYFGQFQKTISAFHLNIRSVDSSIMSLKFWVYYEFN